MLFLNNPQNVVKKVQVYKKGTRSPKEALVQGD